MALRGEGERALKIGVTSSFMGGMISLVVLALFTPILAGWAIKFSAVEKFLIILFALTVIAALSRGPDAPRPVDRYAGRAGGHDEPVLRQQ